MGCRVSERPAKQHRRTGVHDGWVIQPPSSGSDLVHCDLDAERGAVRPAGGHRLHHVGDRHDPGFQQDPLARQAGRVAGAIQSLMMLQDRLGDWPRQVEALDDIIADFAVRLDNFELRR